MEELIIDDSCISCKQDSDYGIVGFNDKLIFHEHYCQSCYFKKRKNTDGQNSIDRRPPSQNN